MSVRVIPRLDIKGPNVVKGVHLEGLRIVGRPEILATRYYEEGADEIIYLDTVASLYGRNSLLEIVARTARELFIPLPDLKLVEEMEAHGVQSFSGEPDRSWVTLWVWEVWEWLGL